MEESWDSIRKLGTNAASPPHTYLHTQAGRRMVTRAGDGNGNWQTVSAEATATRVARAAQAVLCLAPGSS